MYKTLSTALHIKSIKLIISSIIVGLLFWVVWQNIHVVRVVTWQLITDQALVLLLIAVLSFVNLYFETRKWLTLINSPIVNPKMAFRGVLIGMCSGFATPNRLGEFVGRSASLPKVARKKGALMTFAGSGIQGLVTLIAGIIGLIFFPVLPRIASLAEYMPALFYGLLIMFAIAVCILWFRKPLKPHMSSVLKHLRSIKPNILFKASLWAVGRYAIFSTQFVLALYSVGFAGDLWLCYSGVFLLYFCQSYLPFTAMGELGVREVLAIFIFGSFVQEPVLAALASFIVWIANIGLPVLAGLVQLKVSKNQLITQS